MSRPTEMRFVHSTNGATIWPLRGNVLYFPDMPCHFIAQSSNTVT